MPSVTVHCLSGQQHCFQVREDDTIDVVRQRVADLWHHPVLARNVCVLGMDGEVKNGSLRVDEAEFTAVVSSQIPFDRDWTAHADTISKLPEEIHIVFIGDGRNAYTNMPGVGKTSLVFRCRDCLGSGTGWTGMGRLNGSGHLRDDGTVRFHNCEYVWRDGSGEIAMISLSDAACATGELQHSFYDSVSVYVILFSLASRTSFENVEEKWKDEVGDIPVLLVGTKLDLCAELPPSACVSFQEAQAMARRIGAVDYLECSALSGEGVDDVIDAAVWAYVMEAKTERGRARLEPLSSQDQGCRMM
mmetsp:Transcript_44741/g.104243  ORF Transcript_44741/g.104243 Transcript_44741/m.104243 type:complete len:303 (-) Transcript_44741:95-1003(-)